MGKNLFSVPIFFIVFRETLEAAVVVSVLLGLTEQLVQSGTVQSSTNAGTGSIASESATSPTTQGTHADKKPEEAKVSNEATTPRAAAEPPTAALHDANSSDEAPQAVSLTSKQLIKKLRIQIFLGSLLGFFIALAIGSAFIAIWFTQASNLWEKSEQLWSAVFNLVAAIMIFIVGISMLKLDRVKTKWRVKLQRALEDKKHASNSGLLGRWALFILPLITVLREGMEAIVFVGGISLGEPATAIPIATIVGLICGLICGYLIYSFASRTTLRIFLIVMTNFLLLIGAALFSKTIRNFELYLFLKQLGPHKGDLKSHGPGSYDVRQNVWYVDCCMTSNLGWGIFAAIFGWTNNSDLGSVLSYVFYWVAVLANLAILRWRENKARKRVDSADSVEPEPLTASGHRGD